MLAQQENGQNISEQDLWRVYSTTDLVLDVWVGVVNENKSKYVFYNGETNWKPTDFHIV